MRTRKIVTVALLGLFTVIGLREDRAQAQGNVNAPLRLANDVVTTLAAGRYWTAERLASAKPVALRTNFAAEVFVERAASGAPRSSNGRKPQVDVTEQSQLLYRPSQAVVDLDEDDEAAASGVAPQNAGTLNAHFTSSRVFPNAATTTYPYRTVGKLFFSDSAGNNFVCSASVISYRVVVTAGHCVHSGSAAGFYRNFLFVPSFRNGTAPFGTWDWAFVTVTGAWANGGGAVPNAADYAMFEMRDRDAAPQRIGGVTGFLGWQTQSLSQNHTTMLGYPCNLDNCQRMHRVDAGAFRNTSPNNVEYGSDARGGSSGGPWVQNFGDPAAGQTGGTNPGLNRVVAVTSYGYISVDPKVQGAAVPDGRWVELWNIVCAHRAGNCS
jgi:V8-like Glu-specific endopeptidase